MMGLGSKLLILPLVAGRAERHFFGEARNNFGKKYYPTLGTMVVDIDKL